MVAGIVEEEVLKAGALPPNMFLSNSVIFNW
jgi:hypothetical protein